MSESNRPGPVPGPTPGSAAPAGRHLPAPVPPAQDGAADAGDAETAGAERFGDLDQRPVAGHVDVFEAEHARLERELRTIDQL
jgi:hypothetical protein